jgi:hypothetical protein
MMVQSGVISTKMRHFIVIIFIRKEKVPNIREKALQSDKYNDGVFYVYHLR